MKKILAVLLALTMIMSMVSCAFAEGTAYTVQRTPVFEKGEQIGSLNLRFYTDAPHVACLGMKEYLDFLMKEDVTVTRKDGDIWEVARPKGVYILVNPAAGTIAAPDWVSFQFPS